MFHAQAKDVSRTREFEKLETREASPTHLLVKIESFSFVGTGGVHKYETSEFGAGGYKWRLIIHPHDDETGIDSDYLSVYLAISDTASLPASWEVNAVFSFFLFNHISGDYTYSLGRTRRFLPMKKEWGISKFMSKKVLMDPSNGYLVDSNCVFGAEVFIVQKSAVFQCLDLTTRKTVAASAGNNCQMNGEDSMAKDPVQSTAPSGMFRQPLAPSPANSMFGSTDPASALTANLFAFGGQQNQVARQNPPHMFQVSGSL